MDVPSLIDFHDPEAARAWTDSTVAKRPWRPAFFHAFAAALNQHFDRPFTALEVGSGPGHLAAAVLAACRISHYTAVDFSTAMHDLARQHIGPAADVVTFEQRDFRDEGWPAGLGPVDAVLTMQAAHEVRHKDHLPGLLRQLRGVLASGGLLLFADHYAGGGKNPELFPTREDQPILLQEAHFPSVTLLLDHGGMTLYRCTAQA
jgi:SAM-dependent methyltransferase